MGGRRVNRKDGRRTAPSAMNMQEIDIYVYTPEAVYLYLPQEHSLKHLLSGDFRDETVRQPFAKTALYSCFMSPTMTG